MTDWTCGTCRHVVSKKFAAYKGEIFCANQYGKYFAMSVLPEQTCYMWQPKSEYERIAEDWRSKEDANE